MKKNDWILTTATLAYSYLFYRQLPGINLFLFTLLTTTLLWYKHPENTKSLTWKITALFSLFSGFFVMWYGTTLSVTANLISLSLLAVFTLNPGSSLIIAVLNAIFSYLSSIPYMVVDYSARKLAAKENTKSSVYIKLIIIGIPLFITLIFFWIYQSANPIFYNLTKDINFDFISWRWIWFTVLGFILMYGFFYQRTIPEVTEDDLQTSDELTSNGKNYNETWIGKILSLDHELLSGIILFSLLNILLLFVNLVDVSYLWAGMKLPMGMTYSDIVHQGAGAIILSVITAIFIILFYFRDHLNFASKNKALQILAYCWVIQNLFMIFSTCLKNQLYINEYSLTYKRIGVYIYLTLTMIGLVTTFIKVFRKKSNWFLIRKNAWAFYTVLILSVSINWDQMITDYNLKNSKTLDTDYLIDLGYANIPALINIYHAQSLKELPLNLQDKIEYFKWEQENTGWQSWSFAKYSVYQKINTLYSTKN